MSRLSLSLTVVFKELVVRAQRNAITHHLQDDGVCCVQLHVTIDAKGASERFDSVSATSGLTVD